MLFCHAHKCAIFRQDDATLAVEWPESGAHAAHTSSVRVHAVIVQRFATVFQIFFGVVGFYTLSGVWVGGGGGVLPMHMAVGSACTGGRGMGMRIVFLSNSTFICGFRCDF